MTAAATYYLAEIYAHFSTALMQSERPEGLDPLELEEYELAIEEQAYPFEEKAIGVHQSNLELIRLGVYNSWIDKSLARLALLLPARYGKTEGESPILDSLDGFAYQFVVPLPAAGPAGPAVEPEPVENVRDDAEEIPPDLLQPAAQGEEDAK